MKILRYSNGDPMHAIGLGTWKATGETVKYAVKEAVKAGIRHIDTAAIYQNESEIGGALSEIFEEGLIKREEIFITSKLWNNVHCREDVLPALQESLEKLQLDYLDLYLIHWPVAFKSDILFASGPADYISLEQCPISETWRQMEVAKDKGLTMHIGVSNFSVKKLKELKMTAVSQPEMNQVELHPLLQQNELWEYCRSEGILLTAYSPLGSGDRDSSMKGEAEPNLMDITEIKNIAKKHNTTEAQVLISWHLHRNTAVIPKSTSAAHITANFKATDLALDEDDLQLIARLDKNYRFITGKFFDAPEKGYENVYDE
ncbi:MAG: aldo/keto reductase [Flavobacterium sp.]|nr:MAG: aldo/keto reductase [Flavobacterium sp.]